MTYQDGYELNLEELEEKKTETKNEWQSSDVLLGGFDV